MQTNQSHQMQKWKQRVTDQDDKTLTDTTKVKTKHINISAVRAFCPGYFSHFASGLKPRHIRTIFWPWLLPEAI